MCIWVKDEWMNVWDGHLNQLTCKQRKLRKNLVDIDLPRWLNFNDLTFWGKVNFRLYQTWNQTTFMRKKTTSLNIWNKIKKFFCSCTGSVKARQISSGELSFTKVFSNVWKSSVFMCDYPNRSGWVVGLHQSFTRCVLLCLGIHFGLWEWEDLEHDYHWSSEITYHDVAVQRQRHGSQAGLTVSQATFDQVHQHRVRRAVTLLPHIRRKTMSAHQKTWLNTCLKDIYVH